MFGYNLFTVLTKEMNINQNIILVKNKINKM